MAGLINRRRRFSVDGTPTVLGFHAIGDAHICTNPLYGRGCATGFWQAHLLADALDEHPSDLAAQAAAFNASVEEHIIPWYRASVQSDSSNRKAAARARAEAAGEEKPEPDGDDLMRSVIREGLTPASRRDAVVWRAFVRTMNLLAPPQTLMEPDIAGRIFKAWEDRHNRPAPDPLGPPRAELLAELGLTEVN